QQIRGNEAGPRNSVESRVLLRVRDRPGIVVESQNFSGAETPRSERENAGASSGVEQLPVKRDISSNLLQQAKRHRGRRVFAGPERAGDGYDEQRHVVDLRRTRRLT